jgi:hypothetical protein
VCPDTGSAENDMQHNVDPFSKPCNNFGLTTMISTKMTEVMHQPAPKDLYKEPTMTENWQKQAIVDKFVYRGNTLSYSVHVNDKTCARITKESSAFRRLRIVLTALV